MLNVKGAKKALLAGMLVTSIATSTLFSNTYAVSVRSADKDQSIIYEDSTVFQAATNLKEYIQSLKFLSDAEKKQLLGTYERTKPLYEKIDRIYDEISVLSDKLLADTESLYEELDQIYAKQSALWDKMFDHLSPGQESVMEERELIKASSVLNEEEKKILLEEQGKLDKVYEKLDREYDRLEKECAPFYDKIDELYRQIDELDQKDEKIWEKIDKNDQSVIPY